MSNPEPLFATMESDSREMDVELDEQQSTWIETTMTQALDQAKATKEFPTFIKEGSDFHIEFLYRHFTRLSPS